ncbi:MAG: gluconokinase [Cyanobacteria bacterium J06638_22]
MAAMQYIIGVDIGTTSTKAEIFTTQGEGVVWQAIAYPLSSPAPDIQEQNPDEILDAVVNSISSLMVQSQIPPSDLLGICFSAAMHSLIAVDSNGDPLTQSITWADRRSARWVNTIREKYDSKAIYHRTGTPIHSMSPFVKLVWLKHEQPDLFRQAAKFISIKEYILYRWLGEYVVDYSIASATGLLNMQTLNWDEEALEIAGIYPDQLSRIVPTTCQLTPIHAKYAEQMGVPTQLPIIVGSSDGPLANLGVGAISPGVVAVSVGTSGAIRTVLDHPRTDPDEHLFCYALTEKHWVVGGAVNNGGLILRWVRDNLGETEVNTAHLLEADPYNILTAIAATVPPGAEGLIFHPYLAGERSPLWDSNARGSLFGLALHHQKAHIIRAVLEGVVFNLKLVLNALQGVTGSTASIRATGGFARSELWRQMLADIFNCDVIVPQSFEGSCFGAALLGLFALGELPSLEAAGELLGEEHCHQPIPANVESYQEVIPLYNDLLDLFQPTYGKIAALQAALPRREDMS